MHLIYLKCLKNVSITNYYNILKVTLFLRHDQSAFRKGHSTGTALHKLVDDLLDNINGEMMNAICFFDLKEMF